MGCNGALLPGELWKSQNFIDLDNGEDYNAAYNSRYESEAERMDRVKQGEAVKGHQGAEIYKAKMAKGQWQFTLGMPAAQLTFS